MAEATKKATVFIGCRHIHGIHARLFTMVPSREVMPGGRINETKVAQPKGEPVVFRGFGDPSKVVAMDHKGQYGITEVDSAFAEEWLKQNEDSDLVKNGIVFIAKSEAELRAKAKDYKNERTGLEPLDPAKPGDRGIKGVEPAAAAA